MTRIAFEGIVKSFSDVQALSDVTFEVSDGSSTGILGPNGSGKTLNAVLLSISDESAGEPKNTAAKTGSSCKTNSHM